jgi:Terminase large subunit, T4likevirus-type, N-terminal
MTTSTDLALELRHGLDIVAWCRECVRFRPDPWQERVLSTDAPQVLLNICRQGGKSTICALRAAHMAIYRPGTLTLLISRGQRQAGEIYQKVASVFRQLGVKLRVDNQASSELMNGSRVLSLPGDAATIRGFSPDLVIFDEASFVPEAVYNSVRPMLSVSRGQLFLISTPNGRQGFFFEEWHYGASWYREEVTADQCPRISAEFLQAEKQRRGLWFNQEYMCKFEDGTAQLFSHELIASLFSESFDALPLRYFT